MALARFVVTARVSLTADTLATVVAGEPGTGGAAGFGGSETVSPGTSDKYGLIPQTLLPGMVVVADSSAGSTGPQLLYQAIGAGNLRAWTDGEAATRQTDPAAATAASEEANSLSIRPLTSPV